MKQIPAPLWKRFLAYIIDILIIGLFIETSFIGISKMAFGDFSEKSLSEALKLSLTPQNYYLLAVIGISIAILSLLYWSILEYKLGQSIGKMIFRIYTVSEKKKLTFLQALIRNAAKTSSLLLILDALALFRYPYYKRFTEKWSQTQVIQKI